ncbi:MAG TPA: CPBP family intramembrane glutamic endopeptidase [Williamwhitmania sp.]|nr:CPBP family intramembrane glutamic endopeptidase [Williamwhitmania sp.]
MKGWLKALLFFVAWIVTQVLVTAPVMYFRAKYGIEQNDSFVFWMTFITYTIQLATTLGIAAIFIKYIDKTKFVDLGFRLRKRWSHLAFGLLGGFVFISLGSGILILLGAITIQDVHFIPVSQLLWIVLFAMVAVNEETFARGYLLRALMESTGKYWALLISAIVFAGLHGLNPNMSWIAMINLLIAGILLGVYYIHFKNLWFSIGIHLTWNYFQGPVWGYHVSGTTTSGIFTLQESGSTLINGGEFGFEGSLVCTIMMLVAIVAIDLWARREKRKEELIVE